MSGSSVVEDPLVLPPSPENLSKAVEALVRGRLIGLPTETVYGLAADASQPNAVRAIFSAKGRPADHPLIVHVADAETADRWAQMSQIAWTMATRFWPGPLTLVLPRRSRVDDGVTGGQETVAIRCPAHPVALAVLREFAQCGSGAVVAPSANRFGRISPTSAENVIDELGRAVALVLDGGPCAVGVESSIVDLSGGRPRLLRPGILARDVLEAALGHRFDESFASAPRAPGALAAHYAPLTPLRIVRSLSDMETLLNNACGSVALLRWSGASVPASQCQVIDVPATAQAYAHQLYRQLRWLDQREFALILVEAPPDGFEWEAVNDRLRRAQTGSGHSPLPTVSS